MMRKLTLAMSSWVARNIYEAINIAKTHGFHGVEWDTNYIPIPISLDDLMKLRTRILQSKLKFRFHAPNIDVEIGHVNEFFRQSSLKFLKLYVNLIKQINGNYLIIHVGYPHRECRMEYIKESLADLVEYAKDQQVTISLENSPQGFTSNPYFLFKLVEDAGADVTFDIGHINASFWVKKGRSAVEFLRVIKERVTHAHVYLKEDLNHNHLAPKSLTEIRAVLDELINTKCRWWTIELAKKKELILTKKMLVQYLLSDYKTETQI